MRGIRNFMLLLASVALYSGFAGTVLAQTYPTKVIRYIIPDSAGSGGDVMDLSKLTPDQLADAAIRMAQSHGMSLIAARGGS